MEDWPEWLKEAFNQHFIELTFTATQQKEAVELRDTASKLLLEINAQTDGFANEVFLRWEESINHTHTIEKEWLYYEGVKDGLRLMNHIQSYMKTNTICCHDFPKTE